jgi:DNA-binding transcriptional MerR regulator
MTTQPAHLQIGEFARLAATNLRTLRYYEELGLIQPASRSTGGFRHYDHHQLERMQAIKRLQLLGLSLKEIQELMAPKSGEDGAAIVQRVERALTEQVSLVQGRLAALTRDLEDLRAALDKLQMCKTCEQPLSAEHCDPCRVDQHAMAAVVKALL